MTLALTFPAGKILYSTRQTKAMTAGADTVTLTVPTGKVWLLHYIWVKNESTQTIAVTLSITDGTNTILPIAYDAALADNGQIVRPCVEGTFDGDRPGHGAFPLLLTAGQTIDITWGAHAAKADNGYWYAMIREL